MSAATHVWDPDLGPVKVTQLSDADAKRWGNSKAIVHEQWAAYPEDGAEQYHEVFLVQLGSKYRFISWGGVQYGPELKDLVTAVYFAFGHGWIDLSISFEQSVQCMVEMRSNTRPLNDPKFDAWQPMSEGQGANHSRDNEDSALARGEALAFTDRLLTACREVVS